MQPVFNNTPQFDRSLGGASDLLQHPAKSEELYLSEEFAEEEMSYYDIDDILAEAEVFILTIFFIHSCNNIGNPLRFFSESK